MLASLFKALRFSELGQFRFGVYFGFTNSFTWMIAVGTPMILLAEQLGANTAQVGLLYSAVFLFLPVQLLSTALLPILGYKRQMLLAWGSRCLFLFIPLGIALSAPEEPASWVIPLFMGSVFAFCLLRSIGACALLPWLYSIIPESKRGRYFASDFLAIGFAGVITLLLSSALFGALPSFSAFTILYAMTIIAGILSLAFLVKLPENDDKPVVVPLKKLLQRAPQLVNRPSHFRRFLRWQMLYAIAGYAFAPFSAYYLKSYLGYSEGYILALTALQFAGMSIAAFIVKNWIDRIGSKPFFILSHCATIIYQAFWLLMVLFPGNIESLLPAVYICVGLATSTFIISTNKYMPQIARKNEIAMSVSLLGALVGFIGGIAATLWGYALKDQQTGDISPNAFVGYFVFALVAQAYLLVAYFKLREKRIDAEPIPTTGVLVRPFRYLVTVINLVEQPSKAQRANKEQP